MQFSRIVLVQVLYFVNYLCAVVYKLTLLICKPQCTNNLQFSLYVFDIDYCSIFVRFHFLTNIFLLHVFMIKMSVQSFFKIIYVFHLAELKLDSQQGTSLNTSNYSLRFTISFYSFSLGSSLQSCWAPKLSLNRILPISKDIS